MDRFFCLYIPFMLPCIFYIYSLYLIFFTMLLLHMMAKMQPLFDRVLSILCRNPFSRWRYTAVSLEFEHLYVYLSSVVNKVGLKKARVNHGVNESDRCSFSYEFYFPSFLRLITFSINVNVLRKWDFLTFLPEPMFTCVRWSRMWRQRLCVQQLIGALHVTIPLILTGKRGDPLLTFVGNSSACRYTQPARGLFAGADLPQTYL